MFGRRYLKIFTGKPEIAYSRTHDKIIILAGNVMIQVKLEDILKALEEKDVFCKCVKD